MAEPVDDARPPHQRRPRYRGTHPRQFGEKYKEHAADRYPELVAQLRARGHTPAGQHVPILVEAVMDALRVAPGLRGVDATLGWGGHAQAFLDRLAPDGQLLALDVDPIELPKTEARLRARGAGADRLIVRRMNFAGVHAALAGCGWLEGADFMFADLGVSSMQIDDPSRGFSFRTEAALDLRMNPARGEPAAAWLRRASVKQIAGALRDHADEPRADLIAATLVARRGTLTTTKGLVEAVHEALGARVLPDEAALAVRRVFQAIRIAVNDEFGALDALLRQLPDCLRPGGRVAFLTFHSGEDRRVKQAFAGGSASGIYDETSREVIRPPLDEQRANPRAKSAKLRWARRSLRSPVHAAPTPWG